MFWSPFLGSLFGRGGEEPDGIFHQFNDKKLIALFDFDESGYTNWNRKGFILIEEDPRKALTRSNEKNGYTVLLPVPDIPEIARQVIKSGNQTYKEKSYMTTESLLFNAPGLDRFFTKQDLPGGGCAYVITGSNNKRNFTGAIKDLSTSYFSNFIPLFDKIRSIVDP